MTSNHAGGAISEAELTVFPLLANPRGYEACRWDLGKMDAQRAYWLRLFRTHFPTLLGEAVREAVSRGEDHDAAERRADAARIDFERYLDAIAADPERDGRLDILVICHVRERVLRDAGFDDPFRLQKHRENEAALAVLPRLFEELDAADDEQRARLVIEGVFAGNIFDLGATDTAARFMEESVDFHAIRGELAPRPWLIDDLDAWFERLRGEAHRAACLFVDNAGSDVVLGMLPLARELLRRGSDVILTANTTPSLNDITHDELLDLLQTVADFDAVIRGALRDGRLVAVASGNGAPLIDLRRVSRELAQAVTQRGVDLVVIEGMGRGIESNLDAALRCDAMKIAMVKDQGVADALGGKLYDLVLRFDPATTGHATARA